MGKTKNLENRSRWLVGGGVLAAFTASLCCIGPLILTLLGISGAAVISKLAFLRVPMIVVVVALFVAAGYSLFGKRKSCEPDSICAVDRKYKTMVIIFWVGLVVAVLGITSQNWIIWLF